MKLLSISMPQHDVNMSYFDGQDVHYIKLERPRQEKRFHFPSLLDWKREAVQLWGEEINKVDDVVFSFDPGALPPVIKKQILPNLFIRLGQGISKAERLPALICQYLGVKKAWFISHHFSHALSTWMLESQPADLQVVIDGLGDGRPWSVYKNGKLIAAGNIQNGSIGWGMREAGKLLNIEYGHYNDIAGKVMGLQSYGKVDAGFFEYLNRFRFEALKDIWSVEHWYAYKQDAYVGKLTLLDWIATVHTKMGEMLVAFFERFASRDDCISYTGGVAQNVVWNAQLKARFPQLVIAPHSSDEGLSLGALEWLRREHKLPVLTMPTFPWVQADVAVPPPSEHTITQAAELLARGKVVGWYQGQGEIGPRALGNRSILMDPRMKNGKATINKVKRREPYRPFGASVLQEYVNDYFSGVVDPFMLYACQVKSNNFPAITHVDGSSRVQSVNDSNPLFKQLLTDFFRLTGCPLLLNTSLNLAGKPIAAFPEHALQLFYESAIDAVIVGDALYQR